MRTYYRCLLILLLTIMVSGCATPVKSTQQAEATTSKSETDSAAKSNDTEPDYAVVFPQDSVNRIDVTLSKEAWADLQAEMTGQFGAQGAGGQGQAPGKQGRGNQPGGGMGGMSFGDTSYVSSTVTFNGETWENVGFRYSGNSTLQNSWRSGTKKISFRLDFDAFEDEYCLSPKTRRGENMKRLYATLRCI